MKCDKKSRVIKNIEVLYYEIETEQGYVCLCPCYDAELFSTEALRKLLLSDSGRQILACVAVSVADGKITLKIARL